MHKLIICYENKNELEPSAGIVTARLASPGSSPSLSYVHFQPRSHRGETLDFGMKP